MHISFSRIRKSFAGLRAKYKSFLSRQTHRSFRYSRRRDYARPIKLTSGWKVAKETLAVFRRNRSTFLPLVIVYGLTTFLVSGFMSQDAYQTLADVIDQTSGEAFSGFVGGIGSASLLFLATATGSASPTLSEGQQVYLGIVLLLAWLTTVWLLRNILAGQKVKMRDGLYSSGAPLLPTALVMMLMVVQAIPFAVVLIAYSAASATGFLDGGVEAMLFWVSAALLTSLSLYWISSTVFALIIVTLPGMYPWQAIKNASQIVSGRRLKIFSRVLWLMVVTVMIWALIMVPVILLDGWLKSIWQEASWLPIVPVFFHILSSTTVIWVSGYIYIFYRKVIQADAEQSEK
jgi:hypothetical protein